MKAVNYNGGKKSPPPPVSKGGGKGDLRRVSVKKDGFTLLEVIIVLSLIILILGLSTIFFAGFLPSAKLSATGRELSALIRHARSFARMNGETQTVTIDMDGRTYGMGERVIRTFPPNVLITVIDPVSGEILHGKYSLVFHPGGGMEGGTIILSGGKKKMRIDMDPITGAVLTKGG